MKMLAEANVVAKGGFMFAVAVIESGVQEGKHLVYFIVGEIPRSDINPTTELVDAFPGFFPVFRIIPVILVLDFLVAQNLGYHQRFVEVIDYIPR